MAGFHSILSACGIWPAQPPVAAAGGGFRSFLTASGVWVNGADLTAPAPSSSDWIIRFGRRAKNRGKG